MFTVLGAGAWGSALAISAARSGHQVALWGRNADVMHAMQCTRTAPPCLPQVALPPSLHIKTDFEAAVDEAGDVLIATPSTTFTMMLERIKSRGAPASVSWACKGFDRETGRLLSERFGDVFAAAVPHAFISGPTFALEVARGLPTAVAVAASCEALGLRLQSLFHSPSFRVYVNDDLVGVQIGGAVKNVLAIAVGMSDGLGFGANSRAALITRGLSEMTRIGEALGARRETLMGLAGLGDLVLTSTDDQSRNRRYGLLLGAGYTPAMAHEQLGALVEGAVCAEQVRNVAMRWGLELPIMTAVQQVVQGQMTAAQAGELLMSREPSVEG